MINIKDIIQNFVIPKERIDVYIRKSQGASLPTDLIENAYLNLEYLNKLISSDDWFLLAKDLGDIMFF